MKIPKSFKLFATTINVIINNKYCNDKECYGESEYSESRIYLADINGLKELSEDRIKDTFFHEKGHIILDTMGEHELSNKENFVDVFAKLLRQSEETEVY